MERGHPFLSLILRSYTTGLCEDLIKQNKGEIRYRTRSMVTDSIRTCAISNSDSKRDDPFKVILIILMGHWAVRGSYQTG
ncbi:hypothetical protein J6590_005463 [Homalodisca vitripennis]|nr:hypothetical protein J6590_005463 [Homalodisca vitripennis]